ncbi:tyrosine-type recombinase/integrase [Alkalispirochaeta alkalica]|uniref:tyrosine-type recombinase/integrase n=1 Tax=Alkalispirochaeta alkalica TaxID=46356 RepID=UPI0003A57678|nr:tyrosine-type recombinase/integrase [Alkalispirochaeta alkalica]
MSTIAGYRSYRLFKRKVGKTHRFYARLLCPDTGKVLKTISTGETTPPRAVHAVEAYLEREQQRPMQTQSAAPLSPPTLAEIADGFWEWDGEYARSRRARGYSVSHGHLEISEGYTRNHLLPVWGNHPVQDISIGAIDRWILDLHAEQALAPATINKLLSTLRALLDYAARHRYIETNPAALVKPLKPNHRLRGVLTDEEVTQLFSNPDHFTDYRQFAINLFAFTTGARIGEVRGLLVEDVFPDHILIRHAWEEGHGLKDPKYGSIRPVPIPPMVYSVLQEVIRRTQPSSLVFYGGKSKDRPMSKSHIEKSLMKALLKMNEPKTRKLTTDEADTILEDYRTRGITFHSWRHKLNSLLRSRGVPDSKIRILTGHRSEAMTNWYTRYTMEDFGDVLTAHVPLLPVILDAV